MTPAHSAEPCPVGNLLNYLVVVLKELGPIIGAEVKRGVGVLVNVFVGYAAEVFLACIQSLIHKV